MERIGTGKEGQRLAILADYHILDTAPEPQFDEIAELAAQVCGTPMAAISLLDGHRQWFKARIGIAVSELPREITFCNMTIRQEDVLVVQDATLDPRFRNTPIVAGEPRLRFYAGMPLLAKDGQAVGTLSVLDRVPRTLDESQLRALRILAHQVVAHLELRKGVTEMARLAHEREQSRDRLQLAQRHLEARIADRTTDLKRVNIELRREAERRAKEARLSQDIIDSLPGIFYLFDASGHFLRWNRNLETVTGYLPAEISQMHPADLFHSDVQRILVETKIREAMEKGSTSMEAEVKTKDGRTIPYFFNGVRIFLDGEHCITGMGMDITDRRRAEENLRLKNRAIEASLNAIVITDLEGNIEYANPAFTTITGYAPEHVIGRNCRFLQGEDRAQPGIQTIRQAIRERREGVALLRNYRRDGNLFWNDVHIGPVRDGTGKVTHFVGVLNDITEIKNYEEQLEHHANVDLLTRLPNRNVLKARIRQAIAGASQNNTCVAVGFMDLDNFKFINDSLGHTIGDELLKRVAERLLTCLRDGDTVARYGGDEFGFVLSGQEDEQGVLRLLERVLREIERPFLIEGHKFFVSCSIGVSFYPRDGRDLDTLLKNADAAMYRAKDTGRNNIQFYTPAMNKRVTERLTLEARLRQALANDEFVLHYQPKVDLRSGTIVGTEALLRWRPADGGAAVPPSQFIPLAEETGLIIPIGEWALNTACAHGKILMDAGLSAGRIAVNISARQFESKALMSTVRHALLSSGLDSDYLELELTESLVMRNPEEAINILLDLKEMGLRLAIDDFGTGYSSLSYLQRFPVDRLKIDQSFVRDIGADPGDAIIARAIISLGHNLGMSVVAEGVSNAEQLVFLRENGCDEMQGFLFSRPVGIEELTRLLKEKPAL